MAEIKAMAEVLLAVTVIGSMSFIAVYAFLLALTFVF